MKYLIFILFFTLAFHSAKSQDEVPVVFDLGELLLYYTDLGDLSSVKTLVETKGADVNYSDYYGVTSLMLASQMGYDSIVKYLISKSAEINVADVEQKCSPLISAIKNNHFETSEILIRAGADVNAKDIYDRTAIHYAAMSGLVTIVDMLIYYDADIDAVDVLGYSPLCYAVENKRDAVIMLFKLEGAETETTLTDKSNLFHVAATNGNIFFLDNFENDIDLSKNMYGLSPVEVALVSGQVDAMNWFVENGYSFRDTINGVYTARTLARRSGNPLMKKTIRKLKIKEIHYPYFGRMSLGYDMIFNGDDFFMTFNAGILEDRYGFALETGFMFRGYERRILYPNGNDSFYQYREQRNAFYFKMDKHLKLFKTGDNSYLSLFAGVRATYYWGEYDGVLDKVTKQMIASPSVGLALNAVRTFRIFFLCDYMNLPIYKTSPYFYSIGIKGLINIRSYETNAKYNYIIKY